MYELYICHNVHDCMHLHMSMYLDMRLCMYLYIYIQYIFICTHVFVRLYYARP